MTGYEAKLRNTVTQCGRQACTTNMRGNQHTNIQSFCIVHFSGIRTINPLTPTVAIWVQL